jgi:hypothetical protein
MNRLSQHNEAIDKINNAIHIYKFAIEIKMNRLNNTKINKTNDIDDYIKICNEDYNNWLDTKEGQLYTELLNQYNNICNKWSAYLLNKKQIKKLKIK